MTRALLRPRRSDDFGLRRALSDRLLPVLVGAMAFLAALALAGALAASGLARHWRQGAGALLTVQVPQPGAPAADAPGTRIDRVLALIRATKGVAGARVLGDDELLGLLRPWLGEAAGRIALPLPAVIEVRTKGEQVDLAGVVATAPGTLVEADAAWTQRLEVLARSLQACAGLVLAVVAFVSTAVVAVATRAGLAARRDAIETVHGLGATDAYIASRFARRATTLAGFGALAGLALAVPVLAELTRLAAPLTGQPAAPQAIPLEIWLGLPALPLAAAAIGWLTAHGTVRRWLRRLP